MTEVKDPVISLERGVEATKSCRLNVSEVWVCEDGYKWISVTCLSHGDTWRELVGGEAGTDMLSCTTRALGWTLAGFRVFRCRKELERWLSAEGEDDFQEDDDFGPIDEG